MHRSFHWPLPNKTVLPKKTLQLKDKNHLKVFSTIPSSCDSLFTLSLACLLFWAIAEALQTWPTWGWNRPLLQPSSKLQGEENMAGWREGIPSTLLLSKHAEPSQCLNSYNTSIKCTLVIWLQFVVILYREWGEDGLFTWGRDDGAKRSGQRSQTPQDPHDRPFLTRGACRDRRS